MSKRLAQHSAGSASGFTRIRRPVELALVEAHPDRPTALARERQLKRWTRAKKEALVAGNTKLLKQLE